MQLTQEDIKAIRDTHTKVKLIEQTLNGNGKPGLCDDVRSNQARIRKVEIILAAIGGSGAVTGGIFGVAKLIS